MKIKYFLAEDTIDEKDHKALAKWLLGKPRPRLTKGPLTLQFEEKWSRWLPRRYSVFCNSGSSANLLMYEALEYSGRLKKKDRKTDNKKVIVPCAGWPTTIAPAIQRGWKPIMCDADPGTFGLELNHLEDLLKKHNPATVAMVHVLGVPNRMKELMALKEKYGFFLLEDTCAAMGSAYHGRNLGTFGEMASMSFYFGHQISTIEGGMVSTDDRELYNLLLMLRSHGWTKDVSRDVHEEYVTRNGIDDFHSPFLFVIPGYNLRATDLQAFIGLRQIKKMDWLVRRRFENHLYYKRLLGGRFRMQSYDLESIICSIHFAILADSFEQRKNIVATLVKNGIETRMFSAGNQGRQPYWVNRYGVFSTPMADAIHYQGLFLPNHPSLKPKDIKFISDVVREAAQ